MEFLILLIVDIICILSLLIYLHHKNKRRNKYEIQRLQEEYIKNNRQILDKQIRQEIEYLQQKKEDINKQISERQNQLSQLNIQLTCIDQSIAKQKEQAKDYEKTLKKNAEEVAKAYEDGLLKVAEARVTSKKESMQKAADQAHLEHMQRLEEERANAQETIASLVQQIEQYAQTQKAINEAIQRQRLLEEQQDFYRICLTEESLSDVSFLKEVRKNLKKPEIIDKIIYDNYIAKPVLEMIKRVLQNSTCSGIYKITCIKTGEIYIGKSTDIKNRWQQHCKSAFNCGNIANSLLHTKMKQHGIENFTFELVEQVSKDQLSEKEKFYINFYQTKEVGLNERNG